MSIPIRHCCNGHRRNRSLWGFKGALLPSHPLTPASAVLSSVLSTPGSQGYLWRRYWGKQGSVTTAVVVKSKAEAGEQEVPGKELQPLGLLLAIPQWFLSLCECGGDGNLLQSQAGTVNSTDSMRIGPSHPKVKKFRN